MRDIAIITLSDCFDVEQTFDNHKIINLLKLLFTTARNCAALNNIINKDTAVKSQANRLKMSLKKKKKNRRIALSPFGESRSDTCFL